MLRCYAVNCRHNKNQECHGKECSYPGGEKLDENTIHMAMFCAGFERNDDLF